jgi:hypothetical protein
MPVIKRFKILCLSSIDRYYSWGDHVSMGLKMAFTSISVILYVIDIQIYTGYDGGWGIGYL